MHKRRVGGYGGRDCKVLEGLCVRDDVDLWWKVGFRDYGVLELMGDGKWGVKMLLRRY